MRHAKSSHKNLNLNDHDRPLNTRGLNDAPRIHQELSRINFLPNLILVSSSTRTLETLSAMNFDSNEVEIKIMPEIYLAGIDQLLLLLEHCHDHGTTMILGHNPGCELLINSLTGEWHEMPTASVALIYENNGNWILERIIKPKDLNFL